MIVLPEVLTAEELAFVHEEMTKATYEDGRLTAQGGAQQVKNNLQLKREYAEATELDAVLLTALTRHPLLTAWATPRTISAPLINRYEPGMRYGFHVDAPVTTQPALMRRDISLTLFLSDRQNYDGGELEVESLGGLQRIKLPAGHAFAYATHALHQVREVTRGVRYAAVFWIQSVIPDDQLRHSLFDLQAAISSLSERGLQGQELLLLNKVHQNLTRKFARP